MPNDLPVDTQPSRYPRRPELQPKYETVKRQLLDAQDRLKRINSRVAQIVLPPSTSDNYQLARTEYDNLCTLQNDLLFDIHDLDEQLIGLHCAIEGLEM